MEYDHSNKDGSTLLSNSSSVARCAGILLFSCCACTANLYRDLWGFYREMGVQGFHVYRVSLGIKLPVIVTVILQKIHREF